MYLVGAGERAGKTVAAALLCAAGGGAYWKPVQAGLPSWSGPGAPAETDSARVARLTGARVWPEAYRLQRPGPPHAAARDEGVVIGLTALRCPPGRLVIEGVGGWMQPLGHPLPLWQADVALHLRAPVLLISRTDDAAWSDAALTLRALAEDGVPCAGLLFVGPANPELEVELPRWGRVRRWARLPWVEDLEAQAPTLAEGLRRQVMAAAAAR